MNPAALDEQKKRSQASRACSGCHARKVRCDVLKVGCPCTQCQRNSFDCAMQERKKRHKKAAAEAEDGMPSPRSIPEHVMSHQVPYYPFFRNLAPRGKPQLYSQDAENGVVLPVSARDVSASSVAGDRGFLRQKGAFTLPEKNILDECVAIYFRIAHPFFPVIDKPAFLEQYSRNDETSAESRRVPSLLLLQSVVFTAASFIPNKSIWEMGFSTRKQARSCFHQRARYLYDFDYESDTIANIQALLLMSHYYPSMVEQKHTWFWVHQAIGLAQGAGLHRRSGQEPNGKLWMRIWWACVVRDRLIALGTGRPMHINSLDCTVPMLSASDLEEEGDTDDDSAVKQVFIEFVKLCQYMEGVLSLFSVTPDSLPDQIAVCESTLQHWSDSLASVARRADMSDMDPGQGRTAALYRDVLHLIFNIVMIVLYQSDCHADEAGTRLPSHRMQMAAADSAQIIGELIELDLVKFCPTICVTAVLPPLIVHTLVMRASTEKEASSLTARLFTRCMEFLKQLGEIYWHASFYYEFFELVAPRSQAPPATPSTETTSAATRTLRAQQAREVLPKPSRLFTTQNDRPEMIAASREPVSDNVSQMVIDDQMYDRLLEDYTNFHTLFPSA